MVALPAYPLIAPSPTATGPAAEQTAHAVRVLAKREILGTTGISLIVFLILGFFLGVVPWIVRYIYLKRTGTKWHGCFQPVEDEAPATTQAHNDLPTQPYATGDVKVTMTVPSAETSAENRQ